MSQRIAWCGEKRWSEGFRVRSKGDTEERKTCWCKTEFSSHLPSPRLGAREASTHSSSKRPTATSNRYCPPLPSFWGSCPPTPHPPRFPSLFLQPLAPGRPTTISKGFSLSSQGSFPATSASGQKMTTVHEGDSADSPVAHMVLQNCSQPRLEPRVTFRPDVLLSEWYQSAARTALGKAAIAAAQDCTPVTRQSVRLSHWLVLRWATPTSSQLRMRGR